MRAYDPVLDEGAVDRWQIFVVCDAVEIVYTRRGQSSATKYYQQLTSLAAYVVVLHATKLP